MSWTCADPPWLPGDFPEADEGELRRLERGWRRYLRRRGWKHEKGWYRDGRGRPLDDFMFFLLRWRFRDRMKAGNWSRPLRAVRRGEEYCLRLRGCRFKPEARRSAERLLADGGYTSPRRLGDDWFFPPLPPALAAQVSGLLLGHR